LTFDLPRDEKLTGCLRLLDDKGKDKVVCMLHWSPWVTRCILPKCRKLKILVMVALAEWRFLKL